MVSRTGDAWNLSSKRNFRSAAYQKFCGSNPLHSFAIKVIRSNAS